MQKSEFRNKVFTFMLQHTQKPVRFEYFRVLGVDGNLSFQVRK